VSFIEKRPPNWEMGAHEVPEDLFNKPD